MGVRDKKRNVRGRRPSGFLVHRRPLSSADLAGSDTWPSPAPRATAGFRARERGALTASHAAVGRIQSSWLWDRGPQVLAGCWPGPPSVLRDVSVACGRLLPHGQRASRPERVNQTEVPEVYSLISQVTLQGFHLTLFEASHLVPPTLKGHTRV